MVFIMCWFQFANVLLRFFACKFIRDIGLQFFMVSLPSLGNRVMLTSLWRHLEFFERFSGQKVLHRPHLPKGCTLIWVSRARTLPLCIRSMSGKPHRGFFFTPEGGRLTEHVPHLSWGRISHLLGVCVLCALSSLTS